jgi:hypothetical protein
LVEIIHHDLISPRTIDTPDLSSYSNDLVVKMLGGIDAQPLDLICDPSSKLDGEIVTVLEPNPVPTNL